MARLLSWLVIILLVIVIIGGAFLLFKDVPHEPVHVEVPVSNEELGL